MSEIPLYIVEHASPNNILDHFKEHPKIKSFLSQPNLSVLDIGCNVPVYLFFLYHDFANFKKFVGVEDHTLEELIDGANDSKTYSKFISEGYHIKSMYDFYYLNIVNQPHKEVYDQHKLLTRAEFEELYNIHLNTHYEQMYLEQNHDTFDYLILSNIIHLFDPKTLDIVLEKTLAKLKSGGLIYVRANHEDNPHTNIKNVFGVTQIKFNEEKFKKIFKKDYKEIHFRIESYNEDKRKDGLVFFGIKK